MTMLMAREINMNHLPVLPIVLPMFMGALLLFDCPQPDVGPNAACRWVRPYCDPLALIHDESGR